MRKCYELVQQNAHNGTITWSLTKLLLLPKIKYIFNMLILMGLLIHYDIDHQSKRKYLLFILGLCILDNTCIITMYHNSNVSVNMLWAYSVEIRLKSLILTTKMEYYIF